MAERFDLPLPEISIGDFNHAWRRFELVSTAKEWNEAKQKVILPTLLRGKLLDYYSECSDGTRGDLERHKSSLMEKAGLKQDSLAASHNFMSHTQQPREKVSDFAVELKKLFKEAYPEEQFTSAILVQRFLTGLLPKVREQVLLHGKPDTLQRAVEDAINIEYVLNFKPPIEEAQEVHAIHWKTQPQETQTSTKLQDSLDQIVKCLEALEKVKQPSPRPQPRPQQYSTARPQ